MNRPADGYIVWVEFDIDPGHLDAFRRVVAENAVRSVADEPGCRRFDVLHPEDAAGSVALYEIYDDAVAFAAHLDTPHYRDFETASAGLVRDKRVRIFALEEHAK